MAAVVLKLTVDTKTGQAQVRALGTAVDTTMKKVSLSVGRQSAKAKAAMASLKGSVTKMGQTLKRFAQIGLLAVVGGFAATIAIGAKFEMATQKVANVSGAAADQMAILETKARELGSTTAFTATQVMEGMQALASMGMTATEIEGSIEYAIKLAGMMGAEVSTASEMIAVAMKTMSIPIEDIKDLTEVFAVTVQNSLFPTLEALGSAFSVASQIGGALSYSIEEVVAGLRLFRNVGLQGSKAGMHYKMALTKLLKPTEQMADRLETLGVSMMDVNPQVHTATEIFNTLAKTEMDAGDAAVIFSARVGASVAAIVTSLRAGTDGTAAFYEALANRAGIVEEGYAKMMLTVQGLWATLKSAFQEMAIAIYGAYESKLKNTLKDLIQRAQMFAKSLSDESVQRKIADFFDGIFKGVVKVINIIIDIAAELVSITKWLSDNTWVVEWGLYAVVVYKVVKTVWLLKKALTGAALSNPMTALLVVSAATAIQVYKVADAIFTLIRQASDLAAAEEELANNEIYWADQKAQILKQEKKIGMEALEVLKNNVNKFDELGINIAKARARAAELGSGISNLAKAIDEQLPDKKEIIITIDGDWTVIDRVAKKIEKILVWDFKDAQLKAAEDHLKYIGKMSLEEYLLYAEMYVKVDWRKRDILEKYYDWATEKAYLANTQAATDWKDKIVGASEEIKEAVAKGIIATAKKMGEEYGTALYDALQSHDWKGALTTLEEQMYESVRKAVIEALIAAMAKAAIMEPIVLAISQIDFLNLETIDAQMEDFGITVEQQIGKMKQMLPAMQMAIDKVDEYIPVKREETEVTKQATNAVLDKTRAVYDATGALIENTGAWYDSTGTLMMNTGAVYDVTGALIMNTGALVNNKIAVDAATSGFGETYKTVSGANVSLRTYQNVLVGATHTVSGYSIAIDKSGAIVTRMGVAADEAGASLLKASNAAERLYKTDSQYASNTTDNPFLEGVSFEKGTDYVPKTGFALVHEGEQIIPANQKQRGGNTIIMNNYITALDPIGMKNVVEQEIKPMLDDVERREWS